MSVFVDALGWTLLYSLWQCALVGCVAAVALSLLRNAVPGLRYAVACAALLVCIAWPAWTLVSLLTAATPAGALGEAQVRFALLTGPEQLGWWEALLRQFPTMVALWSVCVAVLSLRLAAGLVWLRRSQGTAPPVPAWLHEAAARLADRLALRRPVRLRLSEQLGSPATAGWLRPVVFIPAALVTGMPRDLLEALLAHELAHIRRYDYLANLVQNAVETLLFYHPAVWWLSRQANREREHIADDLAAAVLPQARTLAVALSELEKAAFSTPRPALGADGGTLVTRVARLLRPQRQPLGWQMLLPLALLICLTAVPRLGNSGTPMAKFDQLAVIDFRTCAKPTYPQAALDAGATGTVKLRFAVGVDGAVLGSRVQHSSGDSSLDNAARTAIERCRFKPALQLGRPVPSITSVQYVWTLD